MSKKISRGRRSPPSLEVQQGRMRGLAAAELFHEGAGVLVADPERFVSAEEDRILKRSEKIISVHLPRVLLGAGGDVFFKAYRSSGVAARLKDLFRASRGVRSFRSAIELLERGISTPKPLFGLEYRALVRRDPSYFASSYLSEASTLDDWMSNALDPETGAVDLATKRSMYGALARFVCQIHDVGVYPHDLKAGNIMIEQDADGAWRFFLIDLDNCRIGRRPLPKRRRVRNLMQLNKSFLDTRKVNMPARMRFLLTYLDHREASGYWRRVRRASLRHLRKKGHGFS